MNIPCYIVDDEEFAIECLKRYIGEIPILQLVGSTTSPFEAMEFLQHNDALVFLDINMAGMTGFDLMPLVNNKVIFTTAHGEYALQSYNYENTVDYLLKPITFDRFQLSIKKVLNGMNLPSTIVAGANTENKDTFFLKTANGKHEIPFQSIDYVMARGYYSTIHYEQSKKVIVAMPIKDIESLFPTHQFARIHKSYIINKTKIKSQSYNKVMLECNAIIPVGRTYRSQN